MNKTDYNWNEFSIEAPKKSYFKNILKSQFILCKAEILGLRLNWVWALIIVLITPISIMFFLHNLMSDNKAYDIFILTGNMTISLVTGTMLTLGQELSVLKQLNGFDYYAVLPFKKINLIIAYIFRATLTTIPSMIIIYLTGKYILKMNLSFSFGIVFAIILSGFSLSAMGVFIGIYSKNAQQASMITQIFQPLVVYLAPVFIPISEMPYFIKIISYFIPTTYIANILREGCSGRSDVKSIIILICFSIISIFLIEKKMTWRQK